MFAVSLKTRTNRNFLQFSPGGIGDDGKHEKPRPGGKAARVGGQMSQMMAAVWSSPRAQRGRWVSRSTRRSGSTPTAASMVRAVVRNSGQCDTTPINWSFSEGSDGASQAFAERICRVISSMPAGKIRLNHICLAGPAQRNRRRAAFLGAAHSSSDAPLHREIGQLPNFGEQNVAQFRVGIDHQKMIRRRRGEPFGDPPPHLGGGKIEFADRPEKCRDVFIQDLRGRGRRLYLPSHNTPLP